MISLNIWISISNGIPTLTVQISVKPDPYSALDKPQKHTLRGRTSGRSFTLSAPPGKGLRCTSYQNGYYWVPALENSRFSVLHTQCSIPLNIHITD